MSLTFLFLYIAVFLVIISGESLSEAENSKSDGNVRNLLFNKKNGPCWSYQFRCRNNKCLDREEFCNGVNDCGDNSDEAFCKTTNPCPIEQQFIRCRTGSWNAAKCIPKSWKCDGFKDCSNGEDETDCEELVSYQVNKAKIAARNWILNERNNKNRIQKWGFEIARTAIAFYFSSSSTTKQNYTDELAYELSNRVLSKLALRNIENVKTSELAAFVNSFLAFCINPRKFYMIDLVGELRKRTAADKVANPYAMLALCNANEFINENDIEKLLTAFQKANEKHRIDIQAIIIMALACASDQPDSSFNRDELSDYTLDMKKKQYRNGSVENVKTTALVLQALFASESKPDEDNFDEEKAIKQILRSQEKDGSFGGPMNTYYVIPILSMTSLVNISGVVCPELTTVENEGLEYLKIQVGEKWNITYSIWIGDDQILQRSLTLSVPTNTSFYGVMEYAAGVDDKYKFEYNVRNRKPYIFALSGIMDDPEMEMFWYPYYLHSNSSQPTLISESPADVIPNDNEQVLFWYRKME